MKTPPKWFQKYFDRKFKLVKYPQRQKGPTGPAAVNWPAKYLTDLTQYEPDSNWGVLLGTELEPGRFLADVDFDSPELLPLAKQLLPITSLVAGRASRAISHAFYTTPEPLPSKKFDTLDGKVLVEVRGTKKNGTIGLQTMIPPSVHPSGEVVEWKLDEEIGFAPNLDRQVTLYAVAGYLLLALGHGGLNHDARLAVAGFLLSEGVSEDETIAVGKAIAEATGNDIADVELTVRTTASKIRAHEHVKGKQSLSKSLGERGKAILARIREWLGGGQWIVDPKTDKPVANSQENIRRAMEKLSVKLSYDAFSQRLLVASGEYDGLLDDKWRNRLWLDLDKQFHFRPSQEFFDIVIQEIAYENEFHPVIDYLKALEWDRKPRLDEWLVNYGKAADTPYSRSIAAMVLIAAVRRVRKPGTKFDELLVLESGQGMLKSSALRALCPYDSWFSDDLPLDVDAKQVIERTLGKWIIEAGELAGMRGSQVESLKAMLSRQVDGPVRMAYGRMSVERPRQFISIGTTNAEVYLKDTTGNRRFWPLRVGEFNVKALQQVRDQLWAEAAYREALGESIRLHPSLYKYAEVQQERRRAEDPWEYRIELRFPRSKAHRITPDEVWHAVGVAIDRRTERDNERLLKIMTKLGFVRGTVAAYDDDGKMIGRVKGFVRKQEEGQTKLPVEAEESEAPAIEGEAETV